MTKEHYWPKWLIARTRSHLTSVRLDADRCVNPKTLTVPLCAKCNHDFGSAIEEPVSRIFSDLESGSGISDLEAELLIRWLWKFEGIAWRFAHPNGVYTNRCNIRDRVLYPIDQTRDELTIAISIIDTILPEFGDAPMGVDSRTSISAVYVAGVFSRIAMMVLLRELEGEVPPQFSLYRLASRDAPDRDAKLFFPKTGFKNCVDAVSVTYDSAMFISYAHDLTARNRASNSL